MCVSITTDTMTELSPIIVYRIQLLLIGAVQIKRTVRERLRSKVASDSVVWCMSVINGLHKPQTRTTAMCRAVAQSTILPV